MVNYREILRLNSLNYTQRQIAASVHSSRNTIREVLESAAKAGIEWPLDEAATNEVLLATFYPGRLTANNPRKEADYSAIHKELAKPGVNLSLLWSEYCETCYTNGNTPYMYSQFCDKYRHWARVTKATMRIRHKPGDVMQVDWAGNTIPIQDPFTGDTTEAYLFVAVLPCSCYAYAEACSDMTSGQWLSCHANAYSYFGGVTRLLLPDNLKTGVVKNTRYETILNRSYQELAEYKGASGNGKTYLSNALGNAACRKFKSVRYIRMPELLDELSVAKGCGTFRKTIKSYQKVELLILDEWLIRTLKPQEAYDLLEIVETRCKEGSIIFCTQYEMEGWYERINPDPDNDSPISEAIMDRIIHNAYDIRIGGKISMRERRSFKVSSKSGASHG